MLPEAVYSRIERKGCLDGQVLRLEYDGIPGSVEEHFFSRLGTTEKEKGDSVYLNSISGSWA